MATETELERLVIRFTGDAAEYKRMLEDAMKSTKEAQDKVAAAGKKIEDTGTQLQGFAKKAALALGAIGGAAILKDTLSFFQVQESAVIKLTAAIEANGGAVQSQLKDYQDFASQLQNVTVVGDEYTLGLIQQAESMGVSGDAAKEAAKNAVALAAAKGGEATAYIKATTALAQGSTEMLMDHLPALKNMTDESEKVAYAQEAVAKAFGVAQAEANSSAGKMKQLGNAWGDFKEELGSVVAQGIKPILTALKYLTDTLGAMPKWVKVVIVGVIALSSALAAYSVIAPIVVGAFGLMKAAVLGFNLAMLASPWTVFIAAAGLAVAAGVALGNSIIGVTENTRNLEKAMTALQRVTEGLNTEILSKANRELEKAASLPDDDARIRHITDAIKDMSKDLKNAQKELEKGQKELDTLEEALIKGGRTRGAREEVATQRQIVDSYAKAIAKLKKEIEGPAGSPTASRDLRTYIQELNLLLRTSDLDEYDKKLESFRQKNASPALLRLAGLKVEEVRKNAIIDELGNLNREIKQKIANLGMDEYETKLNDIFNNKAGIDVTQFTYSLRQAQEAVKEYNQSQTNFKSDEFLKQIKEETKVFEFQAKNINATSAEIAFYRMQLEAARKNTTIKFSDESVIKYRIEEQNRAQRMIEGANLVKTLRNPLEVYNDEVKHLNQLFKEHAITQDTYNRGLEAAKKAFDAATNAAAGLRQELQAIDSVQSGSAAGLERLNAYRDKLAEMRGDMFPDNAKRLFGPNGEGNGRLKENQVPPLPNEDQKQQTDLLKQMRDLLKLIQNNGTQTKVRIGL